MTSPIQIWTCAAYQPAYRCGGWAGVRVSQGDITGAAGGERNTTASRMALAGLAAALRDLPPAPSAAPAGSIRIHSPNLELIGFADVFSGLGRKPRTGGPTEDLDLWARISTAATGRRLELVHAVMEPGTPTAFAAAWAELARDKAKAAGLFSAAIPKTNLLKISGLESG
jgi:hypothetical protein